MAVKAIVNYSEVQGKPLPERGEFFKFGKIGDSIEGIYEGTRQQERTNDAGRTKKQKLYDVRSAGVLYTVSGNWDLDQKLKAARKGKSVRITYTGDEEVAGDGMNPMRLFKVEVEK